MDEKQIPSPLNLSVKDLDLVIEKLGNQIMGCSPKGEHRVFDYLCELRDWLKQR